MSGPSRGFVYLVGAGPGDPELLTLKAVKALKRAEVVLCDDLVWAAILVVGEVAALAGVAVGRQAKRTVLRVH